MTCARATRARFSAAKSGERDGRRFNSAVVMTDARLTAFSFPGIVSQEFMVDSSVAASQGFPFRPARTRVDNAPPRPIGDRVR